MQIDDSLIGVPCLEDAIDKHPLVVTPDNPLTDVVTLMSRIGGNSCFMSDGDTISKDNSIRSTRSSCVLVMQGEDLLGIFTERDVVKLTAAGVDFATVKIAEVMVHPVVTLSEASFKDIFAPLFLFRRYRIRHLVVISESKQVIGIVTPGSIRKVLRPSNLLKIRRVSEIMSTQVIYAPLNASVISLAQMMANHRISCIVIVQIETLNDVLPAYKPVGIITERDIVQYQALGLNLAETEAQIVMSTPLFLLNPDDSLWFAHQEMKRRHVQRLVVSWDWGAKLGIVTQTSLLRIFDPMEMYGVVETLQQTIAELESDKVENVDKQSRGKVDFEEDVLPPQNLDSLVSNIQNLIKHLLDNPDLPVDIRQIYLNSALKDIQKVALYNNTK